MLSGVTVAKDEEGRLTFINLRQKEHGRRLVSIQVVASQPASEERAGR